MMHEMRVQITGYEIEGEYTIVAELIHDGREWGELVPQRGGGLTLNVFDPAPAKKWSFEFFAVLDALQKAKVELVGKTDA